MAEKNRILVVDDEEDLLEILRFNLESEGFEVLTASSAEEALTLTSQEPDLMLLDVMMERMSGFELAQLLRGQGNEVPIIFITALNDESDQLRGFDNGGDDYITKPFSFNTVLARIKAVLKRSSSRPSGASTLLQHGLITMNPSQKLLTVDGQEVVLTKKEFNILLLLIQHKGQYFTREEIMREVWEESAIVGDRSVDVHIARLRKKLGAAGNMIGNKSGFGYYMDSNDK